MPKFKKEFGGCAGNIIYNLSIINADAFAIGAVGKDAAPYLEWMQKIILTRVILERLMIAILRKHI